MQRTYCSLLLTSYENLSSLVTKCHYLVYYKNNDLKIAIIDEVGKIFANYTYGKGLISIIYEELL